jgi:hypothetical protein
MADESDGVAPAETSDAESVPSQPGVAAAGSGAKGSSMTAGSSSDPPSAGDRHTDPLAVVVGGFLPRPRAAHAGQGSRADPARTPGLGPPSGGRARSAAAWQGRADLPRETSGGRDEASRDWKLARGRWGLERGGRLSMDLDSGYRLSLKPRRGGVVLSIRRNF